MRVVLQRVKNVSVKVNNKSVGEISGGLLLFVGVGQNDKENQADYLVEKIIKMRIFDDIDGKMNESLLDIGGQILVVSQFTLYADSTKGNRPSFMAAASGEKAENLYNYFVQKLRDKGIKVETGEFGANMEVGLLNDGPVTILLDTEAK
ncbi:MAG: D-tyrosyl-tRNA(Tyr) deacylase [Candidatus Magasanikbacteria bacterium RIFCSPHIGHO2_01_FULL_33_34]|uniref:D-aminoacyl-tRNA deacylase n=1 Tax=Candidatus Magasanikbacteria bacterium RIFCSPHIGHO2_01_FULL_33_34 TaxID=1798671 RepID=A0A1F6LJ84_9BACT|nr:MAG: D-tyrosyl-tRNA(Tyr) deacylase [Candidatus Magasanikbacteria bacterium RIFCSPHIGHO2_01_FULL_33_34]OGH65298.1 MAG: D-tyrosyl-tRNA(Tyr) deacylase [Candidatus Magasanikbacteria bacterium RIFCSPHIGHO2_02_FULL_33_17]OGH76075.1 MAG: D-tyrosyl-tRNA(Tyr) deacylase [Candidatus Magasanikbacteria bacterium RIFCSPLOWO2_01_FULL_33_34]OGH81754.1 MAG: D-tyrosyl-tRNA(Tyr) deacylase [Candidatus Magasanikbacteria bacterium RIFCSPLOWO2_12_FULL_34_7]